MGVVRDGIRFNNDDNVGAKATMYMIVEDN